MNGSIGIIGAHGRLGSALSTQINAISGDCTAIAIEREALIAKTIPSCDLYIVCVQDRDIETAARHLAAAIDDRSCTVLHCSGVMPSTILAEAGFVRSASFHPLASIQKGASSIAGCIVGIEGHHEAVEAAHQLAEMLSAHPVQVNAQEKGRYHAAAVFAANFPAALLSIAEQLFIDAGLPHNKAQEASRTLMVSALANLSLLGLKEGLTGPVARGDEQTLEQHRAALQSDQQLVRLYELLTEQLKRIVQLKGQLTPS